jgi:hypothetical protein
MYKDWQDNSIYELFEGILKHREEPSDDVKFLTTIFLKHPQTLDPVKIIKVDTRPNGFVVYTKCGKDKWKHTIITERIQNEKQTKQTK